MYTYMYQCIAMQENRKESNGTTKQVFGHSYGRTVGWSGDRTFGQSVGCLGRQAGVPSVGRLGGWAGGRMDRVEFMFLAIDVFPHIVIRLYMYMDM